MKKLLIILSVLMFVLIVSEPAKAEKPKMCNIEKHHKMKRTHHGLLIRGQHKRINKSLEHGVSTRGIL